LRSYLVITYICPKQNVMDDKIKEIQDYFKQKILEGDYVIKKMDTTNLVIEIDSQYIFNFWVANGPKFFELYRDFNSFSFMDIMFTEEEKQKGWNVYRGDNGAKIKSKEEQIEQEIKELEEHLKIIRKNYG